MIDPRRSCPSKGISRAVSAAAKKIYRAGALQYRQVDRQNEAAIRTALPPGASLCGEQSSSANPLLAVYQATDDV